MSTPRRNRDAGSGRFVSRLWARLHPTTTVSEPVRPDPIVVTDAMVAAGHQVYQDWITGRLRYRTGREAVRAILDAGLTERERR